MQALRPDEGRNNKRCASESQTKKLNNTCEILSARERTLAQLDVVGLGAGEVLAGGAELVRLDDAQVHLQTSGRAHRGLGVAAADHGPIVGVDEAAAGLNEAEAKEGIRLIFRISKELGITVLMIEHVLSAIMETCHRIMVLNYGRKIADGKPQEIIKNSMVVEAYLGTAYAKSK